MRLRLIVHLCFVCLVSCAAPPPPAPLPPAQRALAISDALVDDVFDEVPERATALRVPGMRYDSLPDDSVAGTQARRERRHAWLVEMRGIDCAALADPGRLACELARSRLEDLDALQVCRFELWSVNQMRGWQVRFTDLAYAQPVGSDDLRAQALARFGKLPAYIDVQIVTLRQGLSQGYGAAHVNVEQVVGQLDLLLAAAPEESPFFDPARRDGNEEFRQLSRKLVVDQINPAVKRYRDFLRTEYLPRARASASVAANPNGSACYLAALRYATTLEADPAAVHAEGQAQLAAIEVEMRDLSRESFGGAPVPVLLQRFKSDPQYLYRSADDMKRRASVAMVRAEAALPRAFGLVPTAPAELEPIPPFQERTAAAHYLAAALDGSRPAMYRIRLYQADKQSWVIGESTAFHEVIPGHHLQVNVANNREGLPRSARFLFNSGFSEGWALYAERLADELGLYSGPADRFGMLSNFSWRAVRMIVDTGIHAQGWDRQRAIDLLLAHTALSEEQAAAEVDRYIAWPGQAPSYMLGYLEIRRLRAQSEEKLGQGFDVRFFHDAVLEHGNVTLPVLRERMALLDER